MKPKTPQNCPSDHSAKDREQQGHFDSRMLIPRRQIEESRRMRRAGEGGQAFQPRNVARLHQNQRSRTHQQACILSSSQHSIQKRFLTSRHGCSPRNRVEIEIEGQPQRRENERPEDDRFLPELTARFGVEGVGWFQDDIRETLPNAGVVRLSEAPAESLHDPRLRSGSGYRRLPRESWDCILDRTRCRTCSAVISTCCSMVFHSTSTALTSPAPSDGKANFTTAGPFVRAAIQTRPAPRWCRPVRPHLRALPHSVP